MNLAMILRRRVCFRTRQHLNQLSGNSLFIENLTQTRPFLRR